jgi:hypothetical protein
MIKNRRTRNKKAKPMLIDEITDPAAVLAAIEEYDRLGRDAFLSKHGFGAAREYFLQIDGRLYDSKAILGVAYGHQYPDRGPLQHTQFTSRQRAVVRRLEELGFRTRRLASPGPAQLSQEPEGRSYWALLARPDIYEIDEAIRDLEVYWWTTKGRPLQPGDRVAIWRARGQERRGPRGVIALGEVIGPAEMWTDEDNDYWSDPQRAANEVERVPIRYVLPPRLPLWMDSEANALLSSLSVARSRGGTVFHITPEQWEALLQAAGGWEESNDDEIEEFLNPAKRRGQGRGLTHPQRRAVELRAMHLAERHYRKRWARVSDVSAHAPFDLLCRSGEDVLYVEVKGTTGTGDSVQLTANEVEHARATYPHVALFVVSGVELDEDDEGRPVARGGAAEIYEPWDIREHKLKPIAYRCQLQPRKGEQWC